MSLVKGVHSDADFRTLLSSADPKKLIVVDFWAACPCTQIAPFYTQLSTKYRHVTFAKLDVDELQDTAQSCGVSAMPTFQFYKANKKIAELKGANPTGLEQLVKQYQGPADSEAASGSASVPAGQSDLTEFVQQKQVECLNQSVHRSVASVWVKDPARFLESDTDEQLILVVPFNQNVKLHSLRITAPKDKAPKTIKTFINRSTLGFDEADGGVPETETLELSEKDYQAEEVDMVAALANLRYVRYQNVQSIVLFIKDNLGGEDTTIVNRLQFFGTPVETTKMSDFRKIEHNHGDEAGSAPVAAGKK